MKLIHVLSIVIRVRFAKRARVHTMTAEAYSNSLITRFSVCETNQLPQGYYRSKLFTSATSNNPLIAAASPLLTLLERMSISATLPPIKEIRNNLHHEIKAFESRLVGQGLSAEQITIAKYLLCATIDELLGKNHLRIHGETANFKAFTAFSYDDIGPEKRFFEIVQFIKERANHYLELIELSYYCLIAGFEGEEHLKPNGRQNLDNLIDELYQLITTHKAPKRHRLFRQSTPPPAHPSNQRQWLTSSLIAVGSLIALFLISHTVLEYKAQNVINSHTMLAALGD